MYSICTCMKIILLGSHIDIQLLLKKNYLLFSFKGPLFTTSKNIHVYVIKCQTLMYFQHVYKYTVIVTVRNDTQFLFISEKH